MIRSVRTLEGSKTSAHSGYAAVNGLNLYYEIHGAGRPLVLLHGGFGTIGMFGELLPALAERQQVVGVELQGHGHTADIDRPLRLELMADDVAALLEHLDLETADILGYSMGGGVALQTAIRHPEVVRRMVIVSTPCRSAGWNPEIVASSGSMNGDAAEAMKGTPMYKAYRASAPRPQDWPVLVGKMGELMSGDYDWTEDFAAIEAPTLIVVGDADFVRLEHAVEMYTLLGGGKADVQGNMPVSQLAILPGTNHYTSFARADLLLPIMMPFLEEHEAAPV